MINNNNNKEYSFTEFKLSERHKKNSEKWFKKNAKFGFNVSNNNGSLKILKYKEKREEKIILKKNNFIITAINKGEWGGGLIIQNDLGQNKKILEDKSIVFIYEFDDKIYFIESLSHLFLEVGIIYELSLDDFSYKEVFDMEDAPDSFLVFENDLYAISSNALFKVKRTKEKGFEKVIINKDIFFSICYPNSIAIIDDYLYVGMRGGLVSLNYLDKKNNWNYYTR
ncbi:hypothetical protein [Tenacibaculum maritimum]|uniref:hypothetical protein n=1 Tax=Tenacibaculum maritimum TaxID=107401 RepID=UPI00133111BD|nr:hypothetical protein [Tenacibaculum maritimum]MCD9586010.1 hypothetical protein [Tenacibaculum maritimum]MCD9612110.1 hypothetical protein [Tenacibaculum maritimum]MCD9622168.1 hypothetical protein [Tenacibaculum maritimum]MCD9628616.1 hypothetical protein [Tenacibaculum maritimum]MCD9631502.1 hypothetical protein [Tenacibaculum maritimum]